MGALGARMATKHRRGGQPKPGRHKSGPIRAREQSRTTPQPSAFIPESALLFCNALGNYIRITEKRRSDESWGVGEVLHLQEIRALVAYPTYNMDAGTAIEKLSARYGLKGATP